MSNKDQFNLIFTKLTELEHRMDSLEKKQTPINAPPVESVDKPETIKISEEAVVEEDKFLPGKLLAYSGAVFFIVGTSYFLKLFVG